MLLNDATQGIVRWANQIFSLDDALRELYETKVNSFYTRLEHDSILEA